MDDAKTLTFYLNASMRARAEAGQTNIINRISKAFRMRGFACLFQDNSAVNLLSSAENPGYSMFHMEDPFHGRALNLRRAYYYPFWRIEGSANRWEWAAARAEFDASFIDQDEAGRFVAYWRKQIFGEGGEKPAPGGYVFAPLQGRLLDRRGFQPMSPLDMLRATLAADKSRAVYVSLHPKERYSEPEMGALNELTDEHARLNLQSGENAALVAGCDYMVTQNSALVLDGYFHRKPAIVFARSEFHHISANVGELGVAKAFETVSTQKPEFDSYLYWLLQLQSINAGRDDAEAKILSVVQGHGWKV